MEPIADYFNQDLQIGDLCLAARTTKYGYTSYTVLLISGRTHKLCRVMSVGTHQQVSEDEIRRYVNGFSSTPRAHGAVMEPWNLVKIGNSGFSASQITSLIKKTLADIKTANNQAPSVLSNTFSNLVSIHGKPLTTIPTPQSSQVFKP